MKYPQLVSTRAVNAISDWLVSRLEQLGVEAPQPYTRLLLSLLQSTIQLNDPIELSNLESFLASRKGGNRRYQTCDTDALKKFNAVQCLKEIVSSEQEITTIENLVDELCEKLKDIEKQTDDSEDEHKLFVATLNLAQQAQHHSSSHINSHHSHHRSHHNHQTKEITPHSKGISRGGAGAVAAVAAAGRLGEAGGEGGGNTKQLPIQTTSAESTTTTSGASANKSITEEEDNNSELDPLDLYRRAFPALSKEMENSFVTYRRNVKWLTWPVEQHKRRDHATSISSSSSTISSNSDGGDGGDNKDLANTSSSVKQSSISAAKGKKIIDNNNPTENASKLARQELFNMNENESAVSGFDSTISTIGAGIKRKTKRRRSQALSKSKAIQQNVRKTSIAATVSSGTVSTSMQSNSNNSGGNTSSSGKNKRNVSPTYWDTDFEGCWEMGRDLIKEFITRQNRNSRNRSTSESAVACNKRNTKMSYNDYKEKVPSKGKQQWQPTEMASISTTYNSDNEDEKTKSFKDFAAETALPPPPVVVDFSFCDYDDYDDTTLASVSELTHDDGLFPKLHTENDSSTNAAAINHRAKRLYERELIPPNDDLKSDEQLDFAQFEAKFNSSVEALWKDAGSDEENKGFHSIAGDTNKMRVLGFENDSMATHFAGPTSLPCDMPFRQNLKNFWTNYYNHHFDLTKMLPASLNVIKPNEINEMIMQLSKVNDNKISDGTYSHKSTVGIQSRDPPEQMGNFVNSQMNISSTTAPTSDYYSIPPSSNLDSMNMNKAKMQRFGIRHNSCCSDSGCGGTIGEERKTPVALFLQNSIWSENANIDGGDTDESFFYKVYNSGKQLNNVTAGEQKLQCDTINSSSNTSCSHNNNSGNGFVFNAPYNASKWSEGINAGPPQQHQHQRQQQQQCGAINQKCNTNSGNHNNFNMPMQSMDCGTDCTDSSSTSSLAAAVLPSAAATTSIINNTNWQLLKGNYNNRQSAMQNAWTAVGVDQMHDIITQQQQQQQQHLASSSFYEPEREQEREIIASPKITLPNHSPTSSGFIAYSSIKSVLQLEYAKNNEAASNATNLTPKQKHQMQRNNYLARCQAQKELQLQQQQKQNRYALDMLEEGENLLTSERTHFHPIKSYTDGHTFDICSELDVIEYQRSSSGYLYFDQEKYLEYMRSDNFMMEDDGSSNSSNAANIGASANPLYANSNCEAATATNYRNKQVNKNNSSSSSNNNNNNSGNTNGKSKRNDFVIKFRLQRTEIACQTDIVPPNVRALIGSSANNNRNSNSSKQRAMFGMNIITAINQPHPLSLIFSNAAKNLKANASANQFVYSDTVEAFTRAMAHFPPPTNTAANQSIWLPVGANIGESQLNSSSTTSTLAAPASASVSANRNCWNIYQEQTNAKKYTKDNNNDTGCDEVDFYGGAGADVACMSMCNRSIMTYMDSDVDMTGSGFVEQEWSMNEIRRKCKAAGHMSFYANASANAVNNNNNNCNNNNNNSNSDNYKSNVVCSVVSGTASGVGVGNGNSNVADAAASDADAGAGAIESVWGMCAACNSELKSIPANRLLRDELQVEADEIMSDLKYMQDLYIGRAGDDDDDGTDADGDDYDNDEADDRDDIDCVNDDDEDEVCAGVNDYDEESNVDTVTSDSDWCAEDLTAEAVLDELCTTEAAEITATQTPQLASMNDNATIIASNNANDDSVTNKDSDNLTVIQKVNRLIAELLRPENTTTNGNGGSSDIFHMSKLKEKSSHSHAAATIDLAPPMAITEAAKAAAQFSGNIWHTNNNERNIWQLNSVDATGSCSTGLQFGTGIGLGKLISGGGTNVEGSTSSSSSSIYPLQLLRQFNVKPIDESMTTANVDCNNIIPLPAADDVADIYRTQINWKHEELARIWQTSPPAAQPKAQQTGETHRPLQLQQPQQEVAQQEQREMQKQQQSPLAEIMLVENASDDVQSFDQNESAVGVADIAEKNMRNLRANADASVAAAAANLQKAQEFLARQGQQCKMALGGFTTGSQLLDSAFKLKAVTRKRRHSASQNYFHTQISIGDDEGAVTTTANTTAAAAITGTNINNNNNKIADLNKYAMMESSNANATINKNTNITPNTTINNDNNNKSELNFQNLLNASLQSFGAAAAAAVAAASNAATKPNPYQHLCGTEDIAYDCNATAAAANKNHTIITCKYHLTTIEPMKRNTNDCGDHDNDGGMDDVGLFDDITMAAAAPLSCLIDKNSSILNHVTMMSRPLTR